MSLVAYGSSDEGSDDSDMEDVTTRDLSTNPVTNKKSETKEDNKEALVRSYFKLEADNDTKSASGLKLPTPKSSPVKSSDISADQGPDMQRKKGKFSSLLPPPKNTAPSISAQADTSVPMSELPLGVEMDEMDEEILEIEDYTPLRKEKKTVKDTEDKPRSVGSMFSLLPPPWKSGATENRASKENVSRKSKQPVKIAVPSAPKADSDEEIDDVPAAKRPKPSKAGSGLSSLLPKPIHSVTVKSDNPNKPSVRLTNRPLIPYTLTKKPTSTKETKKTKNKEDEDNTSDEDEPTSFFTFHEDTVGEPKGSTAEAASTDLSKKKNESSVISSSSYPVPGMSNTSLSTSEATPSSSTSNFQGYESHYDTVPTPDSAGSMSQSSAVAAPYQDVISSSDSLDTQTYYYDQQGGQEQQYEVSTSGQYVGYPSYNDSSTSVSYNYSQTNYEESYPMASTGHLDSQREAAEKALDTQKLQRLQGRKNRGEKISIVDITASDQIGDTSTLVMKQTSEEVVHRPSRKKGEMPSSQQRRKHQITYLAFQAKEREHELRQQWATNRQTRQQTQSKYGF